MMLQNNKILRSALFMILAWCNLILPTGQVRGQSNLPAGIINSYYILKKDSRWDEAIAMLDSLASSQAAKDGIKPYIEAKLLKAELIRLKGNYRSANAMADTLLMSFPQVLKGSDPLLANLYTLKGTIFLTQGELSKGKALINNAISIYLNAFGKEDTLLGPCYNKLGNYFYFCKEYDSASHYYSIALKLTEKKHYNLEDRASYLQNLGIISLEMGEYGKVESYFLESLQLKEMLFPANSFSLGRIYLNIGVFYLNISSFEKSLSFLEIAEKIYDIKTNETPIELGSVYWNKGLNFFHLGEFDLAITYLFNALQIIESICVKDSQTLSSLYSDIGNVYKSTNQFDKAINYYKKSLVGFDTIRSLKIYRNIANLYVQLGNLQKAKDYFNILFLYSDNFHMKEGHEEALTYLHFGNFLIKTGNDSSIYFLNKALEIFSKDKGFQTRDIAFTLNSIGDYYFSKNNLSEALRYYQKSLLSFCNTFYDTNYLNNPPLIGITFDLIIINILNNKGYYLGKLFTTNQDNLYLIASANTYLLCIDIIDQLRMRYREENSQMTLSDDLDEIYDKTIESCYQAYEYTKNTDWLYQAFRVSEKSKSIVLVNELKDAEAKNMMLIPENIKKAEKEIRSNLNMNLNSIREEENEPEPDEKKLIYYRSLQLSYEKKYDSLVMELERNYPDYHKLKYESSVVSVEELQDMLSKKEIIIEYTLLEDCVYIFVISSDNFEVKKVAIDPSFVPAIFALRKNLDFDHVRTYSHKDFMEYQQLALKLYNNLIRPVEENLDDRRMIFIPDEELNYLSFESLVDKITMSDTITFRNLPYLMRKGTVGYAPSATVMHLMMKKQMPYLTTGVLAMAPSFSILTRSFIANNQALAPLLKDDRELPGAAWEAEMILKQMKGKKLVGEEATEAAFKKQASSYNILHFATHTFIDDANPLSSVLSFYPFGGCGEDGSLNTYEIYNMDLKGELAVLSACSTGDGKLQKGEGVISLARAFSYAGIPSVIMTLWDVEDISTGNILPAFYHLLDEGFDKDYALRLAKLNYLEKTQPEIETHPAFWSGFILYGNNRGFRQRIDQIYVISLFALGISFCVVITLVIRKFLIFKKNCRRIDLDIPEKFQPQNRI